MTKILTANFIFMQIHTAFDNDKIVFTDAKYTHWCSYVSEEFDKFLSDYKNRKNILYENEKGNKSLDSLLEKVEKKSKSIINQMNEKVKNIEVEL